MTDTSPHYKEVENLMRAKGFMKLVKYGKFQRINDASDGVDNTSGQKPSECGGGKGV